MASQAAELKMPQAGGSQREPSMEEILASIRRIIEDSDQGRKPDDMLLVEPSTQDAESEPMDPIAANTPASRFDLPGRLHLESDEPASVANQPETVPSARAQARDAVWSEASPAVARTEPDLMPAGSIEDDRMVDHADAAATAETERADESMVAEPTVTAAPQSVAASGEKASLISERTGRQVAAAFGELSEAFEASRRKSFDELASEMMRPMLQDWLDNNLPMLVEKLVREEIERVARGGR